MFAYTYVCVYIYIYIWLPWWLSGKKILPANSGDVGLIPVSRRSPREGNGNTLHYCYLGNPMDRKTWQAAVHGLAKE